MLQRMSCLIGAPRCTFFGRPTKRQLRHGHLLSALLSCTHSSINHARAISLRHHSQPLFVPTSNHGLISTSEPCFASGLHTFLRRFVKNNANHWPQHQEEGIRKCRLLAATEHSVLLPYCILYILLFRILLSVPTRYINTNV